MVISQLTSLEPPLRLFLVVFVVAAIIIVGPTADKASAVITINYTPVE